METEAVILGWHNVLDRTSFKGLADTLGGSQLETDRLGRLGTDYALARIGRDDFWDQIKQTYGQDKYMQARSYFNSMQLDADLFDALKDIGKEKTLILQGNCPTEKARLIERSVDVKGYFKSWYFSCDYQMLKSDPRFLELITAENRLKPESCLFADNNRKNLDGAKAYGMRTHQYRDADGLRAALLQIA